MRNPHAIKVLYCQLAAVAVMITVSWANELFGLPQRIFGGDFTPNWHEAAMESLIILIVSIPSLVITWQIVKRLYYLEGFLRVCAWCRKIGDEERWVSLEEFFGDRFKTATSHGMCPDCSAKVLAEARRSREEQDLGASGDGR